MNRLIFMMGLLFIFMVPQAWGANNNPGIYRETLWNKLTDGIHTIGQNPREAAWTKTKLRNERAATRLGNIKRAKRKAWLANQQ